MAMKKSCSSTAFLMICAILIGTLLISTVEAMGDHQLGWMPMRTTTTTTTRSSTCDGSIGECSEEDEFEMDSEISRRILATNNYISYGALKRNNVPCSRRGASYYNCKPGAQANPYNRGCSSITRCRS